MRTTILSAFLIATGGIALAQNANQHDGHHPEAGQQQAQQTPQQASPSVGMGPMSQKPQGMSGDPMKQMGEMMGMMRKMMPMMEGMQKPDVSPAVRADMMKQMAPMMQQMMPMMQQMMMGGMTPTTTAPSASNMPPHVRDYMQAMDKMHGPMNIGVAVASPDEGFVRGMIPHHQGAIDMAKVALQYAKNEQVRKWANDVIRDQQREISEMEAWLKKNAK